jgi:molybdate transport system substrate-binding protein
MSSRKALLGIIAVLAMPVQSSARAEDITFLCAAAVESWMHDVIPEFQKASGHNVKPTFDAINRITEFVRRGDPVDLAIVSPQQWESLQNEGKLDSTTRVVIAKVGYGVFVKKGAMKPDINSVEAFKRAFLNARSIALFNPATGGPTALFGARILDHLGMSAELKPKIKHPTRGVPPQPIAAPLFELVANGDAEIGLAMISENVQAPGVELVGPLPAEIHEFQLFTTVIPAQANAPNAAKTFIEFLTFPRGHFNPEVEGPGARLI